MMIEQKWDKIDGFMPLFDICINIDEYGNEHINSYFFFFRLRWADLELGMALLKFIPFPCWSHWSCVYYNM